MLLYALGWYTPFFRAAYELVPGVSLYRRPADAVFMIGCLGSILAAGALVARTVKPTACKSRSISTALGLSACLTLMMAGSAARRWMRIGLGETDDNADMTEAPACS